MLKELKTNLEGKEISFIDLDNYMMKKGFYSVFDDGVTNDIKECGTVVYTGKESKEAEIIIHFTITIDSGKDEDDSNFYMFIKDYILFI